MDFFDSAIDYANCELLNKKVVIKSMIDNKFLLESVVTEDNKKRHTIQIKTNNADLLKKIKSVYVSFFLDEGPIQFNGKVRKEYLDNSVEIAISKGTALQLREHARFDTKIPTVIHSVIIDNQEVFFNNPLDAFIVDLSAAGIAIEAPPLALEKKDIFKISFNINDENLEYHYQVMRVSPANIDASSYGCRIVEI